MDPQRFVPYYINQAGNGLPGFVGAPVVYGRGLGSMLSRAFRFVMPFLKRGVNLAKPHLKTAAKGIASDVVGAVTSRLVKGQEPVQEGSGLLQLSRRSRKRSLHALPSTGHKKLKRGSKSRSLSSKKRKQHNQYGGQNIF